MRICPSCGAQAPKDAAFCGKCGTRIDPDRLCPSCGRGNPPEVSFCHGCGAKLKAEVLPADSLPASFAGGRYRIVKFIDEGSRKKVYLGEDSRLDRQVAISVIKSEGLDDVALARVQREMTSAGRLGDHPHIVTVHDTGEEDGQLYVISQYLPGGSLADLMTRSDEPIAVEDAMRIADQIVQALEHAHSKGIVHRDIKPGNVLLTDEQTVLLSDFGLAFAVDSSRLTSEGGMLGTPIYMPPEQAQGRRADPRSDLYSLGAVLYELVTGQPPFVGNDTVEILSLHLNTDPIAPSWRNRLVPPALDELILSLLAKSPEDRPQTASAVRELLNTIRESPHVETSETDIMAARLDKLEWGRLIGREDELKTLRGLIDRALAGNAQFVTISGDQGSGKSRLAEEARVYAQLRGCQVLTGRCYEQEGAPDYWPWVQIIRTYVHSRDADELSLEMGTGASDIVQLAPELRDRLKDLPSTPPLDPMQAQFRLCDSVSSFMKNASTREPLILILDDLQWADRRSLMLLQFLVREMKGSRLVVVGTYAETELERHHPLSQTLAEIWRDTTHERIRLDGLSVEEVATFISSVTQQEPGAVELQLARLLYDRTDGNPFFLQEVVRHLFDTGKLYSEDNRWRFKEVDPNDIEIGEGIREFVRRRLSKLSPEIQELLQIAAVVGAEFNLELLERITGSPADELLELLDQAVASQVLRELSGSVGRYRFTQGVTREVLYEDLGAKERIRLHGGIGEALESAPSGVESRLAELARHFSLAAVGGHVEKAISYARRAAQQAEESFAYDEAAGHYARALDAIRTLDRSEAEAAELMIVMAEAMWRAGDTSEAQATFKQVADIARALGNAELFAKATLGYGCGLGGFGYAGRADDILIGLLEEANISLGNENTHLKVKVLARFATELYFTDYVESREAYSREALEMAERLGDPNLRLLALSARVWSAWGIDFDLDERIRLAQEMVELARAVGDREMELRARHSLIGALLEKGDITGVDQQMFVADGLVSELRMPIYAWIIESLRAMRALLAGRLEEGMEDAQKAYGIGSHGQEAIAAVHLAVQSYFYFWATGRLDEFEGQIREFATRDPSNVTYRAGLAFVYAELGREGEARTIFEAIADMEFVDIPRDGNWLATMWLLGFTAVRLRDLVRAERIYELMLPFAGRTATAVAGAVEVGSIDTVLGALAALLKRWEEAESHFEASIDLNRSIGAEPLEALSVAEFGSMLLARGSPGDRERLLSAANQALAITQRLGMSALMKRLLDLKLRAQGLTDAYFTTSIEALTISARTSPRKNERKSAGPLIFLMTDVDQFSALRERWGQKWADDVLEIHNALLRNVLDSHEGYEENSLHDGFLITFNHAGRALLAAIEIQRAFARYSDEHPEAPLRVRIGLQAAEISDDPASFEGAVKSAADVASCSRGEEILASSELLRLIDPAQFEFQELTDTRAELVAPERIYRLEWK